VAVYTYDVMRLCGIEEEVARHTQEYTYLLYPAVFFHVQFDTYRQYLNATRQPTIVLYAFASTFLLHLGLCHLFINVLRWPAYFVALSMGVACLANLLLVCLYGQFFAPHKVSMFGFLNVPALLKPGGVSRYLAISIPSIVMLCAEWWAMEILILMSANLGTVAIGAMTISYNYQTLLFMVPFGFQIGVTAVMGNAIGEEDLVLARRLNAVGFVMAIACTLA